MPKLQNGFTLSTSRTHVRRSLKFTSKQTLSQPPEKTPYSKARVASVRPVENLIGFVVLPTTTTSLAAWFIADTVSGAIVIDNCTSLDAAIQARQQLIVRLQSAVRRNAKPIEGDATW